MPSGIIKKIMVICLIVFLSTTLHTVALAGPACGQNQRPISEPSPADTFIDVLFFRPVGLALIPIGAALFVISLPFSATGGNVPSAFHNLVAAPAEYTFCRPLGDI